MNEAAVALGVAVADIERIQYTLDLLDCMEVEEKYIFGAYEVYVYADVVVFNHLTDFSAKAFKKLEVMKYITGHPVVVNGVHKRVYTLHETRKSPEEVAAIYNSNLDESFVAFQHSNGYWQGVGYNYSHTLSEFIVEQGLKTIEAGL
jgi:hypothetical protein